MAKSLRLMACSFALAFSIASVAVAQTKAPTSANAGEKKTPAKPSDALTEKAGQLFDQGRKEFDAAHWAEARALFAAAWSLKKHWQIAANLGDCEMELGQYADAAAHYAYYLREGPTDRKQKAKQLFDKALTKVGMLHVETDRAGADVLLDGVLVGKSPLDEPLFVMPGKHTLQMRVANELIGDKSIDAAAGGNYQVKLAKAEQEKPTQPPHAEATPAQQAQPSLQQPQPAPPDSKLPVRKIVIGAGIGTSAALVGTGVVLAVMSSAKGAEADKLAQPLPMDGCRIPGQNTALCGEIDQYLRQQTTFGNAALWTFVAGGIVGGATLAYALVTPRQPRASAAQVLPMACAGGGGLVLRGHW